MGKTIAEVLYDEGFVEGILKGKREVLVHLLRLQHEHMLAEIEATINATEDLKSLDRWFVMLLGGTNKTKAHFRSLRKLRKCAFVLLVPLRAKNLSDIHIPLKRAQRNKERGKNRR